MTKALRKKHHPQPEESALNELLFSSCVAHNKNKLQVAAYRDYLVKNVKTTRNDKERSATARYNLVKKCELNALACLPQFIVDQEIFDSLSTETLIKLGERDIMSSTVTNKLDFLNADSKGEWRDLLSKSFDNHERLFDKIIGKLIHLNHSTTLNEKQKYCAIDSLLFFILFIIRFHGDSFKEAYREGFKTILRHCPDMPSYQVYTFSGYGAFVHYDEDITNRFNQDYYVKHSNNLYLVYANKRTKSLFRQNQGINQDSFLNSIVKNQIKEDDFISLGEYGLKCLRFPTYFTYPLTKIVLSWIRFTIENCKLPMTKKYTAFLRKAEHSLNLEKNRLAQEGDLKKDYHQIMAMLMKLKSTAL